MGLPVGARVVVGRRECGLRVDLATCGAWVGGLVFCAAGAAEGAKLDAGCGVVGLCVMGWCVGRRLGASVGRVELGACVGRGTVGGATTGVCEGRCVPGGW